MIIKPVDGIRLFEVKVVTNGFPSVCFVDAAPDMSCRSRRRSRGNACARYTEGQTVECMHKDKYIIQHSTRLAMLNTPVTIPILIII